MTADAETDLYNCSCCHMQQPFLTRTTTHVIDHDHRTRCYRAAAHDSCNINFCVFLNRLLLVLFIIWRSTTLTKSSNKRSTPTIKSGRGTRMISWTHENSTTFSFGDIIFIGAFQIRVSPLEDLSHTYPTTTTSSLVTYMKQSDQNTLNCFVRRSVARMNL